MSKRTSSVVQTGQLEGAKISIETVHNVGLQESLTITNRGTVVQPMSEWVLASLRGQVFYVFPDDLLIRPGMNVVIFSGQQKPAKTHLDQTRWKDLMWTTDQVWNNHGDTAILFDAVGQEVDRHSYPHSRVLGSSDKRKKALISDDSGFEIVDEGLDHVKKVTRKKSGAMTSHL